MIKKYAPNNAMSIKGYMLPVIKYVSYPPYKHTTFPIKKGYCVLEMTLVNGEKRYRGCTNAYINSELKMIVEFPDDIRDEVVLNWEDYKG